MLRVKIIFMRSAINYKSDFVLSDKQFLSGSFESLYAYFYFRSTFSFTQGW